MGKKVIGIYLAAGKSARFQGNKLRAMVAGKSLGSMALIAALRSNLQEIIVVLRPEDDASWVTLSINRAEAHKLTFTKCADSMQGQSASLQHGLTLAQQRNADAILVILADQPFITHQLLNQYLSIYEQSECYTCIGMKSTYISPPILITSTLYPALYSLQGDEGARTIIKQQKKCCFLTNVNKRYYIDIDTQKDFQRWMQRKDETSYTDN